MSNEGLCKLQVNFTQTHKQVFQSKFIFDFHIPLMGGYYLNIEDFHLTHKHNKLWPVSCNGYDICLQFPTLVAMVQSAADIHMWEI